MILIDGHSLAYRSYYAFAKSRDGGLKTSTGIPTSVCFGFLKSLVETIAAYQPEYMAIAFDLAVPTFRHEADPNYKGDRPEPPADFLEDIANLPELLRGLDLEAITAPGYEADDILGTIATIASSAGYQVKILTGDRDLFQLVDEDRNISVLYLGNNFWRRGSSADPQEFHAAEVKEKLGVNPTQVVDYKALCGDKSDNIPGVKGIGEKTAVSLLANYGSLDGIYAAIDRIPGANQTKLANGKEAAYHSQKMAQIIINVPIAVNLDSYKLQGFDRDILVPLLEKLEFKSYLPKIANLQGTFGGKTPESPAKLDIVDEDLWFFSAEETQEAQSQAKPPELDLEIEIIDTPAKLQQLVEKLQKHQDPSQPVAWDTETSDLEPKDATLVGIGCCFPNVDATGFEINYIAIAHQNGTNLDLELVLTALRPILESSQYPKVFQNTKFDRLIFQNQGIKLAGVVFDTMLASYVLNPDRSHNLTDLSDRYLDLSLASYSDIVPKGKTIADIEIPTVAYYCGKQVYATWQLVSKLKAELQQFPALEKLLLEVEQPLEPVLAAMESIGIRINADYLKEFSERLQIDLTALETQAHEAAGEAFNLGSPKQLSQLLFDKLELDRRKSRKIATGYSTDAATLEKLRGHPVVDAIIEYRTLAKLKSTYVDALPALMRSDTHRVHTDFNQAVTSTGRLSSSNPNLQNIPIRTAFSRQIRQAFLPEPGWLLIAADYSQIELRILAHLSQEPILIEAYRNNEDIHTVTARLMFEKENITPDERRAAKTINFGVIYGMGAQRFARSTGISKTIAEEFIKRFNTRYSRVFDYLEQVKRQAVAQGYVETILGRRRYFQFESGSLRNLQGSNPEDINPDIFKKIGQNDSQLLRAAANAPIQGSSADIIKVAMVKLDRILQKYQARLLLQVHDELVLEVPPTEWEELQPEICLCMENAVELTVPLLVEIHAGENWMEAK
ncbi:DNA polymerase I [Merismopedia glauca]|uniref:DNA polymerase I n=1 Tax=Merismopedia glauca CCAP 1448/3 TaxID=1296344 RepID=A0A2T1CAB7_9CYAN|nr:DNA polymerase I [Merismopedia glauca]PSB05201.1 DNA polymerase I [Merismopedia glauca CCAP 1448/3]